MLQVFGGAATAFYSPASSGLVPELVEQRQLQQANALMGIARYLAFPLGAATGGAIVATVGSGTALLVDAGTYAASALLLSGIRLPARARAASTPSFLRELREGWEQHEIAPDKLSRVSAYSWTCAMVFLPLGYALAGPIAGVVSMSAYLVFGAVWIVLTTLMVFSVPAVRNYRLPETAIAAS